MEIQEWVGPGEILARPLRRGDNQARKGCEDASQWLKEAGNSQAKGILAHHPDDGGSTHL
jgi:hypothetical protein